MTAIFLSPHPDDSVFSCGAKLLRELHNGTVTELVVFSKNLPASRIAEQHAAASILGHQWTGLNFPEAPQRHFFYRLPLAVHFSKWEKQFAALSAEIAAKLLPYLEKLNPEKIYAPWGLGGHIDHLLCRNAVKILRPSCRVLYYADLPYAMIGTPAESSLNPLFRCSMKWLGRGKNEGKPGWENEPLSHSDCAIKYQACLAYGSQYPDFFRSEDFMKQALCVTSERFYESDAHS